MAGDKTEKTTIKCDICSTCHSNQSDYNNHVKGNKHKRKVYEIQTKEKEKLLETKGVIIKNVPINTVSEKTTIKCDICFTYHANQSDYNNHVKGNKHKRQVYEIQTKEKKKLFETKGVIIRNLPRNAVPDEILAYVSSFGNIEKSIFGKWFLKVLFRDQRCAATFKNRKHVFKHHTLKTRIWTFGAPTFEATATEDQSLVVHNLVNNSLTSDLHVDQEIYRLQSVLNPPHLMATCQQLCSDLTSTLSTVYTAFSVHPFGSMATGLAFKGSDLDVFIDTTFTLHQFQTEEQVCRQSHQIKKADMTKVSKALWRKFFQVIPIYGAKVPIIKCIHRSTKLNCDISFTNVSAVQNSNLIGWYISCDARVKPLLIVLKYWAKFFNLTKSCFTNYALVMMGLFYLMQLEDPILPPVIHLQENFPRRLYVDGWNCSFDPYHRYVKSTNTTCILDLLQGFFEFYANFDYGMNVICPLVGKVLPKILFQNVKLLPPALTSYQLNPQEAEERLAAMKIDCSFCVQDPFILDTNITRSIPQVAALQIQALCLSSKYVIKEQRKVGPTGILKHLLTKRTEEVPLVPLLGNNVEIKMTVGSYVPIVGPEATTLSDAQNVWYNKVFTAIIKIFENIFKLEVVEDISSLNINSKTIICKSKGPDLLSNRKQVGKKLQSNGTDAKVSFIELQERITEYLMAQNGPVETVEFKCCVHMLRDPTHIILELSDLASSERVFSVWASFLAAQITNWTRTIMDVEKKASKTCVPTTHA